MQVCLQFSRGCCCSLQLARIVPRSSVRLLSAHSSLHSFFGSFSRLPLFLSLVFKSDSNCRSRRTTEEADADADWGRGRGEGTKRANGRALSTLSPSRLDHSRSQWIAFLHARGRADGPIAIVVGVVVVAEDPEVREGGREGGRLTSCNSIDR